jgi:hypothetical protein
MGFFSNPISSIVKGAGGIFSGTKALKYGKKMRKLSMRAFEEENPFGPYRKKYADMLGKLMDDPGSFLSSPLYQAAFGQGTQAVMRGMGAGGYLGSGNMATGLQQFGMGFAKDFLQDEEKFMSHLAGADQDPDFSAALQGYATGIGITGKGWKQIIGGTVKMGEGIGQLAAMSDRRLKTDVVSLGTDERGVPIYQFRYKWDPTWRCRIGTMAQDLLNIAPQFVHRMASGFFIVDYPGLASWRLK